MISLSESCALRIWITVLKKSQLWELTGWLSGSYSNSGRTRDYAMNVQTTIHCEYLEFKIFSKWFLLNSLGWSVDAECSAMGALCFPWNAEYKKDQMNNIFCVYSNYGITRDYAMNVQTTKYCNECMEAFLLSQQHWKNTSYVTNLRELIESFHNSRLPL